MGERSWAATRQNFHQRNGPEVVRIAPFVRYCNGLEKERYRTDEERGVGG
jgi:hypothetical protein